MPDITETISLLDEPKANSIESIILIVEVQENGIIRNSKGRLIGRLVNDIDYKSEHIEGMKKEIQALRQAALDGERYRMEAEAGRIVEEMVRSINQRREETRKIFAQKPDFARGYIQAYAEMGRNFAHAYRQAVEQREV